MLATTIDQYCYLQRPLPAALLRAQHRIVYPKIEHAGWIDRSSTRRCRESLRYVGLIGGVEMHHDGDLPARSGMGVELGVHRRPAARAVRAQRARWPRKTQLAREAIDVEQDVLGETVGSPGPGDRRATAGCGTIEFPPNGEIAVEPLILPRGPPRRAAART